MNTDKVNIKNEKENESDIIVLGLLLIDIIMNIDNFTGKLIAYNIGFYTSKI